MSSTSNPNGVLNQNSEAYYDESQRTPRRTPMACMYCRGRKMKCDGGKPCQNCDKRQLSCSYRPVNDGSTSKSGA
ncbi:hypothetical protein CYLTODRAFT_47324 [Cylindrobasidium torrendii FP15055 ss-10]|uniref:Zn(2)-C6 fungal-type domain-containing protein n=1 Tax=Cylindrobasidium torrendii FP15055 ss-10 TaxID=1314674 RepID=A0A0D7BQG1_9AGAR|nr:hypothetical protein CYLTODRAFT_47324 [Cylindrobasidium torrendii FP15055 ss-10]